ncbi:MAG: efflux RND transporter periplasmic adaptor subunit [Stellaceae bacterium]
MVAPASGVPVTAGTAVARDVPVYVRSLGTVQAYDSVTVRTRVDGQVTKVFFKEGQEVKAGDPLFQIDPRPFQAALEQAQATKQKDEAQLVGARRDLARYAKLVEPGYQTRQVYEDEQATVAELEAAVKADQAQIDAAQLNLTYANVQSPIGGRTGARLVDFGNFVQASQATPLVTIVQLKPIYVTFTAPQNRLDAIRLNRAKAPLTALAYNSDDQTLLSKGELTLINNQVDTTTGTVQLKATFPNQDERLWPGEFVNVRLIVSTRKGAVTVPAQTVMEGPSGDYVYVIKPDNTVIHRDATVLATQDGLAVIGSGLKAGERVVVNGQLRLTDGAKVNIVAAPKSS